MKYYFPTSTLNFDAIYSSMSIMPPSFHREEAIWFSRYFKTGVDVSDEVIVLYSRPVKWEVLDEGSVDFPMLVEMDSSIVESLLRDNDHCVRADLSQGVSCVFINIPIIFRTVDLISGKIKIIFRNQQEQKELVSRARAGVAECKFANALEDLQVDFFRDVFPDDAISFNVITADVLEEIGKSSLKFVHGDFEEYECQDRERGAEAGFMAGKWIHSVQSGYCLDCFRDGFDYDSWKKMLPPEFANIIDMLCNKIGFRWDVNRSAIVDFCAECWKRCFNVGENNLRVEQWHIILQKIAKCHKDPTFSYPVRSITDRYMQALACFIGAGKRSNILAKSIQDDKVAMPELALALHGALVGYSVFQRIFFELRNFESLPPPPPPPPPQSVKVTSASSGLKEWMKRIWEAIKVSKTWAGVKPQQQNKKKIIIDKVLGESKNEDEFFDGLADQQGCKNLAKEIKRYYLSSREGLLFENSTSSKDNGMKSILADNSWITAVVAECVLNGKARAVLEKDLKWYIEEREKKGSGNPEYAQQYVDKSNSTVINRVREFLENQKYHPTEKQRRYYHDKIQAYQDIDVERVVHWLRDRFEV